MTIKAAEFIGLCGLVVSLVSIWLHWDMQQRIAGIEDRHKDGRITETQADSKLRFWKFLAPALTLTGVALLGIAAYRMLK